MTRREFTRLTCDRCGLEDEADPTTWGLIKGSYAGPDRAFDLAQPGPANARKPFDLCPDCARAFFTWWSQGKTGGASTKLG